MDPPLIKFSSELPIQVMIRPASLSSGEWLPFERGPAYFAVPADQEILVSIKNSDDEDLKQLVKEIKDSTGFVGLDLSENRKITDRGLTYLHEMGFLKELDLSSCDITNEGIIHILRFTHLEKLDLRFCHRLTDQGVVKLKNLLSLKHLDLRSLPKISNGSLSKLKRKNLTILH